MDRFYITQWPLTYGVVVAEGKVSSKQAKVAKRGACTQYKTTFQGVEFTTDLTKAKEYVEDCTKDEIKRLENLIEKLKESLIRVQELDEKAEVWTATGWDGQPLE